MDQNAGSFTVLFEAPFWVGIAERWSPGGCEVAKVTFGAEPGDAEVYQWIQRNWNRLRFCPAGSAALPARRKNPKRAQREIRDSLTPQGVGTRARQAVSRQREAEKRERAVQSRRQREEEARRRFDLHRQKKKERHRGR